MKGLGEPCKKGECDPSLSCSRKHKRCWKNGRMKPAGARCKEGECYPSTCNPKTKRCNSKKRSSRKKKRSSRKKKKRRKRSSRKKKKRSRKKKPSLGAMMERRIKAIETRLNRKVDMVLQQQPDMNAKLDRLLAQQPQQPLVPTVPTVPTVLDPVSSSDSDAPIVEATPLHPAIVALQKQQQQAIVGLQQEVAMLRQQQQPLREDTSSDPALQKTPPVAVVEQKQPTKPVSNVISRYTEEPGFLVLRLNLAFWIMNSFQNKVDVHKILKRTPSVQQGFLQGLFSKLWRKAPTINQSMQMYIAHLKDPSLLGETTCSETEGVQEALFQILAPDKQKAKQTCLEKTTTDGRQMCAFVNDVCQSMEGYENTDETDILVLSKYIGNVALRVLKQQSGQWTQTVYVNGRVESYNRASSLVQLILVAMDDGQYGYYSITSQLKPYEEYKPEERKLQKPLIASSSSVSASEYVSDSKQSTSNPSDSKQSTSNSSDSKQSTEIKEADDDSDDEDFDPDEVKESEYESDSETEINDSAESMQGGENVTDIAIIESKIKDVSYAKEYGSTLFAAVLASYKEQHQGTNESMVLDKALKHQRLYFNKKIDERCTDVGIGAAIRLFWFRKIQDRLINLVSARLKTIRVTDVTSTNTMKMNKQEDIAPITFTEDNINILPKGNYAVLYNRRDEAFDTNNALIESNGSTDNPTLMYTYKVETNATWETSNGEDGITNTFTINNDQFVPNLPVIIFYPHENPDVQFKEEGQIVELIDNPEFTSIVLRMQFPYDELFEGDNYEVDQFILSQEHADLYTYDAETKVYINNNISFQVAPTKNERDYILTMNGTEMTLVRLLGLQPVDDKYIFENQEQCIISNKGNTLICGLSRFQGQFQWNADMHRYEEYESIVTEERRWWSRDKIVERLARYILIFKRTIEGTDRFFAQLATVQDSGYIEVEETEISLPQTMEHVLQLIFDRQIMVSDADDRDLSRDFVVTLRQDRSKWYQLWANLKHQFGYVKVGEVIDEYRPSYSIENEGDTGYVNLKVSVGVKPSQYLQVEYEGDELLIKPFEEKVENIEYIADKVTVVSAYADTSNIIRLSLDQAVSPPQAFPETLKDKIGVWDTEFTTMFARVWNPTIERWENRPYSRRDLRWWQMLEQGTGEISSANPDVSRDDVQTQLRNLLNQQQREMGRLEIASIAVENNQLVLTMRHPVPPRRKINIHFTGSNQLASFMVTLNNQVPLPNNPTCPPFRQQCDPNTTLAQDGRWNPNRLPVCVSVAGQCDMNYRTNRTRRQLGADPYETYPRPGLPTKLQGGTNEETNYMFYEFEKKLMPKLTKCNAALTYNPTTTDAFVTQQKTILKQDLAKMFPSLGITKYINGKTILNWRGTPVSDPTSSNTKVATLVDPMMRPNVYDKVLLTVNQDVTVNNEDPVILMMDFTPEQLKEWDTVAIETLMNTIKANKDYLQPPKLPEVSDLTDAQLKALQLKTKTFPHDLVKASLRNISRNIIFANQLKKDTIEASIKEQYEKYDSNQFKAFYDAYLASKDHYYMKDIPNMANILKNGYMVKLKALDQMRDLDYETAQVMEVVERLSEKPLLNDQIQLPEEIDRFKYKDILSSCYFVNSVNIDIGKVTVGWTTDEMVNYIVSRQEHTIEEEDENGDKIVKVIDGDIGYYKWQKHDPSLYTNDLQFYKNVIQPVIRTFPGLKTKVQQKLNNNTKDYAAQWSVYTAFWSEYQMPSPVTKEGLLTWREKLRDWETFPPTKPTPGFFGSGRASLENPFDDKTESNQFTAFISEYQDPNTWVEDYGTTEQLIETTFIDQEIDAIDFQSSNEIMTVQIQMDNIAMMEPAISAIRANDLVYWENIEIGRISFINGNLVQMKLYVKPMVDKAKTMRFSKSSGFRAWYKSNPLIVRRLLYVDEYRKTYFKEENDSEDRVTLIAQPYEEKNTIKIKDDAGKVLGTRDVWKEVPSTTKVVSKKDFEDNYGESPVPIATIHSYTLTSMKEIVKPRTKPDRGLRDKDLSIPGERQNQLHIGDEIIVNGQKSTITNIERLSEGLQSLIDSIGEQKLQKIIALRSQWIQILKTEIPEIQSDFPDKAEALRVKIEGDFDNEIPGIIDVFVNNPLNASNTQKVIELHNDATTLYNEIDYQTYKIKAEQKKFTNNPVKWIQENMGQPIKNLATSIATSRPVKGAVVGSGLYLANYVTGGYLVTGLGRFMRDVILQYLTLGNLMSSVKYVLSLGYYGSITGIPFALKVSKDTLFGLVAQIFNILTSSIYAPSSVLSGGAPSPFAMRIIDDNFDFVRESLPPRLKTFVNTAVPTKTRRTATLPNAKVGQKMPDGYRVVMKQGDEVGLERDMPSWLPQFVESIMSGSWKAVKYIMEGFWWLYKTAKEFVLPLFIAVYTYMDQLFKWIMQLFKLTKANKDKIKKNREECCCCESNQDQADNDNNNASILDASADILPSSWFNMLSSALNVRRYLRDGLSYLGISTSIDVTNLPLVSYWTTTLKNLFDPYLTNMVGTTQQTVTNTVLGNLNVSQSPFVDAPYPIVEPSQLSVSVLPSYEELKTKMKRDVVAEYKDQFETQQECEYCQVPHTSIRMLLRDAINLPALVDAKLYSKFLQEAFDLTIPASPINTTALIQQWYEANLANYPFAEMQRVNLENYNIGTARAMQESERNVQQQLMEQSRQALNKIVKADAFPEDFGTWDLEDQRTWLMQQDIFVSPLTEAFATPSFQLHIFVTQARLDYMVDIYSEVSTPLDQYCVQIAKTILPPDVVGRLANISKRVSFYELPVNDVVPAVPFAESDMDVNQVATQLQVDVNDASSYIKSITWMMKNVLGSVDRNLMNQLLQTAAIFAVTRGIQTMIPGGALKTGVLLGIKAVHIGYKVLGQNEPIQSVALKETASQLLKYMVLPSIQEKLLDRFGINVKDEVSKLLFRKTAETVIKQEPSNLLDFQGGGWREDILESTKDYYQNWKNNPTHPMHDMRIDNRVIYDLPQKQTRQTMQKWRKAMYDWAEAPYGFKPTDQYKTRIQEVMDLPGETIVPASFATFPFNDQERWLKKVRDAKNRAMAKQEAFKIDPKADVLQGYNIRYQSPNRWKKYMTELRASLTPTYAEKVKAKPKPTFAELLKLKPVAAKKEEDREEADLLSIGSYSTTKSELWGDMMMESDED